MTTTAANASATVATRCEPLAFDDLVARYGRELYRYAYRLSGHIQTAEDLVQESLMRAWGSLHRLQNPAAVRGWLYTIVRRENARRFERPHLEDQELPGEDFTPAPATYDTSTEAFVLRRAILALPAKYREPLILQVLHGLSQEEIAERLGLSPAGVGTRLFRARQQLREALGEAD
jgi:RNA polymerase sigma-70 factor (ECF subfamily)